MRILPIVSHMRWSMFAVVNCRGVICRLIRLIVVICGLANFKRTSWSTQRRHEFWKSYEELGTGADYDKSVDSFDRQLT